MEAARPRPVLEAPVDFTLPPPPTPFPTDLISPETTVPNDVADASSERLRTLQAQIGAVQRSCVDTLADLLSTSPSFDEPRDLPTADKQLAIALTELLEVTYDLESSNTVPLPSDEGNLESAFQALTGNLEDLQTSTRQREIGTDRDQGRLLHPSVYVVREELAWARLESLSNAVVSLVRERKEAQEVPVPTFAQSSRAAVEVQDDALPPRYSLDEQAEADKKSELPDYADRRQDLLAEEKPTSTHDQSTLASTSTQAVSAPREKMLLELDGLTEAIDRLHSVAPRLNDQRVELRASSSKSATMPTELRARAEREKVRELELIWDQIERTHGKRRLRDGQRVDMAGWEERRARQKKQYLESLFDKTESNRLSGQDSVKGKVDAELARARDLRDRDLFLRDLVEVSADTRLSNQDANGQGHSATMAEARRQRFFASLMDNNQNDHLDGQDYPQTMDERLDERRHDFFASVVERSANGRLKGQDSAPPTPRTQSDATGHPDELVSMQDFFREKPERSPSIPDEGEKKSNGFSRIKGMIRRGSVGLGLSSKGNGNGNNNTNGNGQEDIDIDLVSLSYVAEHQENLNVVQIMVHGPGISSTTDLSVETDGESSDKATLLSNNRTTHLRLTLPTPVVANQRVPLVAPNYHLEAKLAADPVSPSAPVSSLNTMITQALCAADLRQMKPKTICCTACDRQVADLPVSGTFKDLPSEHWAEMLEVWMCHADPGFTAEISAQTKDGFWPSGGAVLVGGSYLLLENEYIKNHNIVSDASSVNGWRAVSCRCGEVLGKQREQDGRPGQGTMRFSKWSIALLGQDSDVAESAEPVRFPLSVFLVSDMLGLAQAHASYRFAIADETTSEVRLVIWLFNPSVRISYRQSSSGSASSQRIPARSPGNSVSEKRRSWTSTKSRRSSFGSIATASGQDPTIHTDTGSAGPKSLRASKIMYKVIETQEGHEKLPGFGPTGQVEELSYPREVCERVIASLRESTALYPIARRTMGVFEVGFLERV